MAIVVGCKKCPIFSVCPLKDIIGDYKKEATPKSKGGKTGKSASKSKKSGKPSTKSSKAGRPASKSSKPKKVAAKSKSKK